jgi:cell pole-organizing protein PopZ
MAEAASKSESMEDILQSIKRIIEDDSSAEPKPVPAAATADVLDLTQAIKEDGSLEALPPLPAPADVKPPEEPEKKVVSTPPPTPAPKPAPKPIILEEGLVSDQAAQAAAAALKPIVEGGNKDYSIPHIPSSALRNGNTVEDLVLEALRPMLKAWLDEHLPLIVQKIVEKEVKRIVTFHND